MAGGHVDVTGRRLARIAISRSCERIYANKKANNVAKKLVVFTLRAQRSVSSSCPIRMVSALMNLNKVSCTSLREVRLPFKSSSLMPENLDKYHTHRLLIEQLYGVKTVS